MFYDVTVLSSRAGSTYISHHCPTPDPRTSLILPKVFYSIPEPKVDHLKLYHNSPFLSYYKATF